MTSQPIMTVEKRLYREQSDPTAAPLAQRWYAGPNGEMCEWQSEEVRDGRTTTITLFNY